MKANLFLNGAFAQYGGLIDRNIYSIAADGGVVNALKNGVIPVAIVGDGDSLKEIPQKYSQQINNIPVVHTPDQDFTDFEKAITYLKSKKFTSINVFCFDGDRIDHMIAGLSACSMFVDLDITLYTHTQCLYKLPFSMDVPSFPGETLSLMPVPYAKGVFTKGLQWELQGDNLELGGFISISNKSIQKVLSIKYTSGCLFIFRPIKIK